MRSPFLGFFCFFFILLRRFFQAVIVSYCISIEYRLLLPLLTLTTLNDDHFNRPDNLICISNLFHSTTIRKINKYKWFFLSRACFFRCCFLLLFVYHSQTIFLSIHEFSFLLSVLFFARRSIYADEASVFNKGICFIWMHQLPVFVNDVSFFVFRAYTKRNVY